MRLKDLNSDQIMELKRNYVSKKMEEAGEWADMMDLMDADDNVTMDDLEAEYGGTDFAPEDFFCTANQPTGMPTDRQAPQPTDNFIINFLKTFYHGKF